MFPRYPRCTTISAGVASPGLILIHHSVGVPEFYKKSADPRPNRAQNQLPVQTFLLPHHEDLINFGLSTLGDRIERNLDFFESFVSLQSFKQSLAPLLCDTQENRFRFCHCADLNKWGRLVSLRFPYVSVRSLEAFCPT